MALPTLVDLLDSGSRTLAGDTALSGGLLRLTTAVNSQVGAAWSTSQVDLSTDWICESVIQMVGGADGMCFVLQSLGTSALGGLGIDIGYTGITQSVCVKFDIHFNIGDPSDDCTGLFIDGAIPIGGTDLAPFDLSLEGNPLSVVVRYTASARRIDVMITDRVTLVSVEQSYSVSIPAHLKGNLGHFGWVAATGSDSAVQDVISCVWQKIPAAPLEDDLQVIVTSAGGSQRRRLPRIMLGNPSGQIERYGGYGACTLPTFLDFTQKPPILMGDRLEIFYKGNREYRGYISERHPASQNPRHTDFTCYGAYVGLRKQVGKKNYAFPAAGVDAHEAFAAFAADTLLPAIGPQGIRLISSVQALQIGTLENTLSARQELAGDVIDSLMERCGNLAIWGVDVDDAGNNRLYIRPVDPAYPPTYVLPVPSRMVETADSEEQAGDVVNVLIVKGGAPVFPNLAHNGAFELAVQSGGEGSNIILNGSFETGGFHAADFWSLSTGATPESGKNSPPASASAYLGNRYLELDHTSETAEQSENASLVAGKQYTFSVRSASEIDSPISDPPLVSGTAELVIKDGSASVLTTRTITLNPQGQAWDYFLDTFEMPAGAASYALTLSLQSITPKGGQIGGLVIDDVQLYNSEAINQDGWKTQVIGPPAQVISVNWAYPSSWDGGYCVYIDAIANDAANEDLKLIPQEGNRFKVHGGQELEGSCFLNSPPQSTHPDPPKFFMEFNWYDSSGNRVHADQSTEYTPAHLTDWTQFTFTANAPSNAASADFNITWRSAGSLLVDGISVIDAAGPQPTGPDDYLPDGNILFVIRTDDSGLADYRTAQGKPLAPYANSIALYGPQADTVQDDSILDKNGAYAVADAKFEGAALPYFRPNVRVMGDTRRYWPGQTVSLQGKDGPSLAPLPLPISRIQFAYEKGTFKITLQPFKEQPDSILVFKKLARAAALKYGTPAGQNIGGGFTSVAGANITTASNKTQVTVDDVAPEYLSDKLPATGFFTWTIANPGADEAYEIGLVGVSSVSQGDLLYASGTDTFAKLAKSTAATRYLANTGASNAPAWDQVSLSNGVTGNLPVTRLNGGTGASSTTFWAGDGTWKTPSGSGAGAVMTVLAGEAITSLSSVYIELVGGLGSPGYAYNTDATIPGKSSSAFLIGVATSSASALGDPIDVQWGGVVSGFTGLVDGTPYFLAGSGALSSVGSVLVGVAVSSTDLVLNTRGSQTVLVPAQLFPQANLVLWIDSSTGVTSSGGNVSAWADSSPTASDFSLSFGTPVLTPNIFGSLPGIFFDGSSGMTSATWSGWASQTDVSVYAVVLWETQPGVSNGNIIGNRGSNGGGDTTWCLYTNNTPQIGVWNGTTFTGKAVTASPGTATILSAIGDGTDIELFQDGGSIGTEGYGLGISTQTHLTLGFPHPALTLEFWKGYIGAVLVYNQKLNSTDDAAVITYLKSRFGIP